MIAVSLSLNRSCVYIILDTAFGTICVAICKLDTWGLSWEYLDTKYSETHSVALYMYAQTHGDYPGNPSIPGPIVLPYTLDTWGLSWESQDTKCSGTNVYTVKRELSS